MFEFNLKKALEVIVYFSHKEKEANKVDIDLIKINKYCYYAEQYHLKKYLRPIFGDTYAPLPEGPVPSIIYDIIKLLRGDRNEFLEKAYKSITSDIEIPIKFYFPYYIAPLRDVDKKKFSSSEIEAMDETFKKYHAYPSPKLSEISHKEKAWINAQKNSKNEMDFQEIIGDSDAWNYIKDKTEEVNSFRASFQL